MFANIIIIYLGVGFIFCAYAFICMRQNEALDDFMNTKEYLYNKFDLDDSDVLLVKRITKFIIVVCCVAVWPWLVPDVVKRLK